MTADQPGRMTPDVWVIGTASLDVLHLGADTVSTVGGAGLYTALAAAKAGAPVGFCAPRPAPMPAVLQPVEARVSWSGPVIPPELLPRAAYVRALLEDRVDRIGEAGTEAALTSLERPTD